MIDIISDYYITEGIDNFSDHLPLHLSLNITISTYEHKYVHDNRQYIAWNTASKTNILKYERSLNKNLLELVPPFQAILCDNFTYTKHCEELESYHDKLVNACLSASLHLVQKRSSKKHRIIPRWNDMLQRLKGASIFLAHSMENQWASYCWLDCGYKEVNMNQISLQCQTGQEIARCYQSK